MIKEAYCSYEVAKLLKEKGFNEPCHKTYDITTHEKKNFIHCGNHGLISNLISAPTAQMALAWLRDKGILLWIYPTIHLPIKDKRTFYWVWDGKRQRHDALPFGGKRSYDTYEEATEAALKYSLENLI